MYLRNAKVCERRNAIRSSHGRKTKRIRPKPLRRDLGAPQDKNKKGLDDPPIMSLTSSSSS